MKKQSGKTRHAIAAAAKALGKALKLAAATALLFVEDVLILAGLGMMVYATFCMSRIAGYYAAGAGLFGLGVWSALHPPRGRSRR